jgi:glutathione S-transferase
MATLIAANDGPFKHHLDRFKYGDAHSPGSRREHGEAAYAILRRWNRLLERPLPLAAGAPPALDQEGPWLLGQHSSLADWALLPFVRQLRLADPETFAAAPGLDGLRAWLARFEGGGALATVMVPPLAHRQPWRSPSWIYHLALAQEWRESEQDGVYRRSTRGLSLDQVGFIHASDAHQIAATFGRFYVDAGPVLLLSIDPQRLRAAGITIAWQPDPASGELFPHILGALPCPAVVVTEPYQP